MGWKGTRALAALAVLSSAGSGGAQSTDATPTCSELLGIESHGQHVVGDYVTGIGHENLIWPPPGRQIGEAVTADENLPVKGGPGPGFHFEYGFAPGASFCTDSQSPGWPHD